MNSEFKAELDAQSNSFNENQKEKQAKLESEVKGKGEAALAFMKHPFWVLFDKDLQKLEEDLMKKLLSGGDLKKGQQDRIIDAINLTKTFRSMPESYVTKLKLLVSRKIK